MGQYVTRLKNGVEIERYKDDNGLLHKDYNAAVAYNQSQSGLGEDVKRGLGDALKTSVDPLQATTDVLSDLAEAIPGVPDLDKINTRSGQATALANHGSVARVSTAERTRAGINRVREPIVQKTAQNMGLTAAGAGWLGAVAQPLAVAAGSKAVVDQVRDVSAEKTLQREENQGWKSGNTRESRVFRRNLGLNRQPLDPNGSLPADENGLIPKAWPEATRQMEQAGMDMRPEQGADLDMNKIRSMSLSLGPQSNAADLIPQDMRYAGDALTSEVADASVMDTSAMSGGAMDVGAPGFDSGFDEPVFAIG